MCFNQASPAVGQTESVTAVDKMGVMWKHNTPGVQDFQRLCAVGNCSIFLKEEADTTQAGLALLPHLEEEGRSISFEYFPFPVAKAETTTTLLRLKCENWIMPKPSRETRRKYSRLLWV